MIDIMLLFWGELEFFYWMVEFVCVQSDGDWCFIVIDDVYFDLGVVEYFG